ncbi:uncharacterized protein METZ01_LOCUS82390 [marine metagenome]|uniref:Uncharacterized protein n=1 Tax=marine metagenome TaxID=408172 RepID=A0A381UN04_9ZZZZ
MIQYKSIIYEEKLLPFNANPLTDRQSISEVLSEKP